MKFLSLSRPWDHAILDLPSDIAKTIENRGWLPPVELIGQRIALHAAKSFDDAAFSFFGWLGIAERFPQRYDAYPFGVIRGVATIDRCVSKSDTLTDAQRRWFFEKRADGKQNYGWLLVDVRRLVTPVPCRGVQGLRECPPDVNAAIEAQL